MTDVVIDIESLRQWIGREEVVIDHVSVDLVHKFRAMLDLGSELPKLGDIAPRLIHFCLGQPAMPVSALGRDGHPARGGFLPPVALPRRMWAGGSFEFYSELHVGDAVRKTSRIADVVLKQGRTGALCFVTVIHDLDVNGRAILREQQDIVYRGDESGVVKALEPAPQGQRQRSFETSTTTLFRYSALTFNGHRIHYDRRYALEVEGYAGLVVHGPLQATLLHNFAADIRGVLPTRFSFRGHLPLIDDDICAMHANNLDDTLKLWTARAGGPVAMAAEASWR